MVPEAAPSGMFMDKDFQISNSEHPGVFILDNN
jgi:hypothetical protein